MDVASGSTVRSMALACGGGVLYALAQPGFGLWPLAPVCLVPLLSVTAGQPARRRAFFGWLYGTVATTCATAAAGTVGATTYFDITPVAGAVVALAVGQSLGALGFAVLAVAIGNPREGGLLLAVVRVACALVAIEFARGALLGGFPWMLLAYAVAAVPPLTQAASQGGVLAVSWLLAALNAALFRTASPDVARPLGVLLGILGLFVVFAAQEPAPEGPGSVRQAAGPAAAAPAVRVALVQSGVAIDDRPISPPEEVRRLARLSDPGSHADVVVWPENAIGAVMPTNAHLMRVALDSAPDRTWIVGAPRQDSEDPRVVHTAALLFDGHGTLLGHHDKVKLLPFAEFAPWPLEAEALGIIEERAAHAPRVLAVGPLRFGPLLCYEVLFAELARALVREDAGILINLSNDAWFGDTTALDQQLAAAVYRAVETRRPLLRATSTGITAAIDAAGRVVARLPAEAPGVIRVDVEPGVGSTPAATRGGGTGWLSVLVAVGAAAWTAIRRPARGPRDIPRSNGEIADDQATR